MIDSVVALGVEGTIPAHHPFALTTSITFAAAALRLETAPSGDSLHNDSTLGLTLRTRLRWATDLMVIVGFFVRTSTLITLATRGDTID